MCCMHSVSEFHFCKNFYVTRQFVSFNFEFQFGLSPSPQCNCSPLRAACKPQLTLGHSLAPGAQSSLPIQHHHQERNILISVFNFLFKFFIFAFSCQLATASMQGKLSDAWYWTPRFEIKEHIVVSSSSPLRSWSSQRQLWSFPYLLIEGVDEAFCQIIGGHTVPAGRHFFPKALTEAKYFTIIPTNRPLPPD